ncbi:MAG: EI24 domain-containing protein [Alphaproteobacteria bacterium]|nr:EI24 domain-containing protein [Alphaproteobacteria bacterium]
MLRDFGLAVAQLGDRAFRRPLVLGLALSALVFVALWVGVWLVLRHTHFVSLGWVNTSIAALGELAAFGLAYLLYPGVVGAVTSLFLDQAILAVEVRHYPRLGAPRSIGLGEQAVRALRLLVLTVALNLLVLPLYLVPLINLLVFLALNGYILGREYFEMVAPRRADPSGVRRLWRDHRWTWIVMGAAIAFLSTLPVINLIAPLLGAAAMVHRVERLGIARVGAQRGGGTQNVGLSS